MTTIPSAPVATGWLDRSIDWTVAHWWKVLLALVVLALLIWAIWPSSKTVTRVAVPVNTSTLADETYRGFEPRFSAHEKIINSHTDRLDNHEGRILTIEKTPAFDSKAYGDRLEALEKAKSKELKELKDKVSALEEKAAVNQQVAAVEPPKDGVRQIPLTKQEKPQADNAPTSLAPPAPDNNIVGDAAASYPPARSNDRQRMAMNDRPRDEHRLETSTHRCYRDVPGALPPGPDGTNGWC